VKVTPYLLNDTLGNLGKFGLHNTQSKFGSNHHTAVLPANDNMIRIILVINIPHKNKHDN
jgi:hypothetical protein